MSLPEKPLTRRELYLAKAAGQDVTLPETDLTREEMYLREIANGGGGGDVTKEYVDNAIADAVAGIDDDISALSDTVADKVDKVNGKGLSTNDYTDADKALVQDSPITTTSTTSPISTANGKPRKLTVYGKSEVIDGVIKSAGEGYAVVRLADLTWEWWNQHPNVIYTDITDKQLGLCGMLCSAYPYSQNIGFSFSSEASLPDKTIYCSLNISSIFIKNTDYNTKEDFVASLGDAILAYQLAEPSQGNTIAIKTDNGTGVNGTMATFTTGTPLRGIPDTTVQDVMTWDGTSGEATKKCSEVDLGTISWLYYIDTRFFVCDDLASIISPPHNNIPANIVTNAPYDVVSRNNISDKKMCINSLGYIIIMDSNYNDTVAFTTAMSGIHLVYPLATPTTTPLTTAENASIAALRTFTPQTHIQNNAGAEMKIEAYANTANGQAISDMQPTRSPLLTLTASGWVNNAQTVTFVHDTGRRNSIDVEPTSIKAWTAAGILATAETATSITFECDTVPTSDLSFRVTSMEVR